MDRRILAKMSIAQLKCAPSSNGLPGKLCYLASLYAKTKSVTKFDWIRLHLVELTATTYVSFSALQ